MANRDRESDWARQVPERWRKGPYRDYGWEAGQSGLPEFRDPDVHFTPEEWERLPEWRRRPQGPARRGRRERDYFNDEFNVRRGYSAYSQEDMQDRYGSGYAPQGYYETVEGRGFNDRGDFNVNWGWESPGPFRGLGPRAYRRSDQRVFEDVCERLTQHGQVDASDMEIEVKDGEVYLKGTVSDRRTKRLAEDVAESITGVRDVHNQLRLSRRPGGGAGRIDEVERSGVYPASGPLPESDAEVHGMASWGQGERGAEGYEDHGESELRISRGEQE